MAHRARKRFGQNFLVDATIIDRILKAIHPQSDDHIVEIGPGQGALTGWLGRQARKLTVVEIDRDLVATLEKQYGDDPKVQVVSGDALKVDFRQFGDAMRIVGNLPYNISTPLLFHFAQYLDQIHDMHFMLQREVVQRLVAEPGSKTFGRLSVMIQSRFDATPLFDIGPEAFNPAPKVWSAMVRLTPRQSPIHIQNESLFSRVVTQAFSQRRKTLRNSLRQMADSVLIEAAGIDPAARPETLSVEAFAELANLLDTK